MGGWYQGDVLNYCHLLKLFITSIVSCIQLINYRYLIHCLTQNTVCFYLKLCFCFKRDLEDQAEDLVLKLKAMKVTIIPQTFSLVHDWSKGIM